MARNPPATKIEIQRAVNLAAVGHSHSEVGRILKRSRQTIIRRAPAAPLNGEDVAQLMALLKIARTQLGSNNTDDHVDGVGYVAIAGELASE